jgi:hypothetical protein
MKEATVVKPRNVMGVILLELNDDAVVGRHAQDNVVMDVDAVVQ